MTFFVAWIRWAEGTEKSARLEISPQLLSPDWEINNLGTKKNIILSVKKVQKPYHISEWTLMKLANPLKNVFEDKFLWSSIFLFCLLHNISDSAENSGVLLNWPCFKYFKNRFVSHPDAVLENFQMRGFIFSYYQILNNGNLLFKLDKILKWK